MRISIIIGLLLLPALVYSQARRAQSLIEKEKLDDAYFMLKKAIAKDSLASAEQYVLAGLFYNDSFSQTNLDSAYYYILEALSAYELLEPKEQETLSDRGFNPDTYTLLKREIEQSGFERAVMAGQEEDFIRFLDEFTTSIYIDSAVTLRNKVAYATAQEQHTWQAYLHFLKTYPEAKEVPEARENYERLLYEEKTADGKLRSYQEFLKQYPETYHRQEAEQHIFAIITGAHTPEAYTQFLTAYPESYLARQARLSRYALLPANEKDADSGLTTIEQDSIRHIDFLKMDLVLPVIHENEYQLINSAGKTILSGLNNLSPGDKCLINPAGVFLNTTDSVNKLLAVDGSVLAIGDFITVTYAGKGLLRLQSAEKVHFVHQFGAPTTGHGYKAAHLAANFIAFKEKSRWGLESITGIQLIPATYDSITSFHNYVILQKGNKWGLLPTRDLFPLLDGDTVDLPLDFDHILRLNDEYLLVGKEDKTGLLNKAGNYEVPLAEQSIELVENGYFVDRGDSILDSRISKNWYYNFFRNEDWLVGDMGSFADIFYRGKPAFVATEASLIGNSALKVLQGDSLFCYFSDTVRITLSADDLIQPIRRMGDNSTERHYIYTHNKRQKVYNNQGFQVNVGRFDKLFDLGTAYMLRRIKGSSALLNEEGKVVLKDIDAATYLGIGGYISYLKDGKFGLFNSEDTTHIKAKYDRPLVSYDANLFIVTSNNKFGLINHQDSLLVPVMYNEIVKLNDSIAVLNNNFRWIFWELKTGKVLLDNVSDYWDYDTPNGTDYKIFKGIGYGIWSPATGMVLNPTFGEITVLTRNNKTLFIAEKWVEEADLVVMLYYNEEGNLIRKAILSTQQYEDLACQHEEE